MSNKYKKSELCTYNYALNNSLLPSTLCLCLLHTKILNQMTVNTKQIFICTTYEVLYTIDKCFPNAIYLVYTVILHVVNVLPSPQIWTIWQQFFILLWHSSCWIKTWALQTNNMLYKQFHLFLTIVIWNMSIL